MKNVDQIIADIIKAEGGYVDHPNDRGGPTKYGITLNTLGAWLGRKVTAKDVQAITRDTAYQIYYRNYYAKPGFNELPEALQPHMTDIAVNCGPKTSIKMLQNCLLNLKYDVGPVDGYIGNKTNAAIDDAMQRTPKLLLNELVNRRKNYYRQIIKDDPSQKVFEKGWMARAESFRPTDA